MVDLDMLSRLLDDQALFPYCINLLSPQEQLFFARFTYRKRRQEWLGGRLAAKYSLARYFCRPQVTPGFMQSLTILPDDFGAPRVHQSIDNQLPPMLSISHSHQYAVAMVSVHGTCGIDIQKKTAQLLRVQDRFVVEDEVALFNTDGKNITILALIWAAKEAVKKSKLREQPSSFTTIRVTEVRQDSNTQWTLLCRYSNTIKKKTTVHLMEWEQYIIGCTKGDQLA